MLLSIKFANTMPNLFAIFASNWAKSLYMIFLLPVVAWANEKPMAYQANIELPTVPIETEAFLVHFSSLSPALLANICQTDATPSTEHLRIVDRDGRVMPMALRPVIQTSKQQQPVQWVQLQTNDPNMVEKLRKQFSVQVSNLDNLKIEMQNLPNIPLTNANPSITWWLKNPLDKIRLPTQLQVSFNNVTYEKPLELQVFASDDLENWQQIEKKIWTKLNQPKNNTLTINIKSTEYSRFWQIVANQPIQINVAKVEEATEIPNYFLTRVNFEPISGQSQQWQLQLPQPILVSGMDFLVPEHQIWQVKLIEPVIKTSMLDKITTANSYDSPNDKLLAQTQVSLTTPRVLWQPTISQNLQLIGQMNLNDVPVTLLSPVYELYFLAQGNAPYQLVIRDTRLNNIPNIILTDTHIQQIQQSVEGQLDKLEPIEDPNQQLNQQKQWLLWISLLGILMILSMLAYHLYRQTAKSAKPS